MNPLSKLPTKVRLYAYLAYGVGSLVLTYLAATGHAAGPEISAWTGLGALLGLTAATHVPNVSK